MNYLQRKLFRRIMCGVLTSVLLQNTTVIASYNNNNDNIVKEESIVDDSEENDIIVYSEEEIVTSPNANNISDIFYLPGDLLHLKYEADTDINEINILEVVSETSAEEITKEETVIEEPIITEEEKWTSVIYFEEPYTKYVDVDSVLNVRIEPVTERDNIIGGLYYGEEVTVIGSNEYYIEWVRIEYKDKEAYVHTDYLVDEEEINFSRVRSRETMNTTWTGEKLNSVNGRIAGPSGNETYYNLPMDKVVYYMNQLGYDYEVWTREDGVKMFGDYVMVAANLSTRPKGSLVETSLGTGMVVDTGAFVNWDPTGLDIAVTWK